MNPPSSRQPRLAVSHEAPASARRTLRPRFERLAAVAAGIAPPATRSAAAVPGIAAALPGFDERDYGKIPVVCAGERLLPGATYLDLRARRLGAFSAPIEAYTGEDACYVAEADVEPQLWSRLLNRPDESGQP